MSHRITTILDEARIVLNDAEKHRWTDERLVNLLSTGQREMCRKLPLLVSRTTMLILPGQEEYQLPFDSVRMLSVKTSTGTIPVVTMEELDSLDPDWEDAAGGSVEAIVVNNLSQRVIRPYPLIAEQNVSQPVKIRYSRIPEIIEYESTDASTGTILVSDELSIEEMWDYALTQYVIGKAFVDYGDATSLSRAQVALGEYGALVKEADKKAKKSFSKRRLTTGYNNKIVGRRDFTYNTQFYQH